ncbi:protocadherin-15 isoform X1 [Hippocampus zosterae]|uniref:protocadherin-15 isoform X1 n=1 Tax=Hippocampus zosterae TaxID=109293 RepID=UPI00223D5170|nr:protocadherin-15 isoform X1 [Hippocampus zosterae]XP_051916363.1 protocadherin-15 isoform X1 [Hippocampus zosterae]XP_051916364.1 protocadherin-15 isoform X1 [Hippocampus zosterae]
MAPIAGLKWTLILMLLLHLHAVAGMSGWGSCLDGQDIYSKMAENSLCGEVVADLMVDTPAEGVEWRLDGKDSDWFFLDGGVIRLNSSPEKVLDRELQGPVLLAELSCYEDDVLQSVSRIIVEVLNENDNWPEFTEDTIRSVVISELTPVGTLVFTVLATDADNDHIIYSIDQSSPDADYFKIDLHNSGEVMLAKALDYETKTQLFLTILASEMNTAEHFNTSTDIMVDVQDVDDQYPQFLPCTLLFQDRTNRICTSPLYTVNVTEGKEDFVLDFSPGPIHAVDGDRGLSATVNYAILSGDDHGRFLMDRLTGEVRFTRAVNDRLATPALHLQVMAFQDDDPRKYSVATVLVRVLAVNRFHPVFDMAEYHGFVTAAKNPASLVYTYGNRALMLHVQDQDFKHGFNPMIYFTFSPASNHTSIYRVTQEGLLIARANQLKARQKHLLHVMARDRESGDTVVSTVVVEVLSESQSIPLSALVDDRVISCTLGKALFLTTAFLTVVGCALMLVLWLKRKHKGHLDPLERGCVAQGKHPNVSLRWFQLVNPSSGTAHADDVSFSSEDYGTTNPSFSFSCKDSSSRQGSVQPNNNNQTALVDATMSLAEAKCTTITFSNSVATHTRNVSCLSTFRPNSVDIKPAEPKDSSSDMPPLDAAGPSTCLDFQTNTTEDFVDTPSSPSPSSASVPRSQTRLAAAEIEKPFSKPHAASPPNPVHSPQLLSPRAKQTSTPPPTPEQAPLKATLVMVDASPEPSEQRWSEEEEQPCTSLDQPEQPEHQEQEELPQNSEDNDGILGDEDADKNSEGELEPDEAELLRLMSRCNPMCITFTQ